jgi:hypothetical protein
MKTKEARSLGREIAARVAKILLDLLRRESAFLQQGNMLEWRPEKDRAMLATRR